MVVATMVAALALVNVVVTDAQPAQAVGAFYCADVYTQQGTSPRNTWQVDRSTGAQTSHSTFSLPAAMTGNLNGLGIEDRDGDDYGDIAIGVIPANSGTGRSIYQYSAFTAQTTLLGAGTASAPVTHGAINPVNHNYYYGGFSGDELRIYGFNTTTNQPMGLVAQGDIPNGGANGDWAFDSQGNLYVVGGGNGAGTTNRIVVIDQEIPATGGSTIAITGTLVATVDTGGVPLNGIAFAGTGYLHVASSSRMYEVHPTTGQVLGSVALSSGGSVDMASCASPNSVTLEKDFPAGRHTPGDQATLTIAGPNITEGNTATTTGDASGIQAEHAGPVLVLAGQEITVTETGSASSERPKYDTSWICVNQNSGATLASGTGTSGSFVVPEGGASGVAALCTFIDRALLPHITLEKTASTSTLVAGETVTYTFAVTNDGNVPLNDVNVTDDQFTGAGDLSDIVCPADAAATLAPGATVNCTATYVVQQADVDAGAVQNTATAHGTSPDDVPATSEPSSVTLTAVHAPALSIMKSSDTAELVLGETATFSFVVTNTGDVTLSDVSVMEGEFTGAGDLSAVECPADRTLAPGEQLTCSATYVVQQADVDAGTMSNTATATGIPPGGDVPIDSPPSTVEVPSDPEPAITIVKSADTTELVLGDTVDYSFRVTNAGNVTLSDVSVVDGEFTGAGDLSAIECPSGVLAPGAFADCTATYVVQQADVDAGSVTNTATATGIPPGGDVPIDSPPSTVTIESVPDPALTIVKSSDTDELIVGETVTYSFLVANTGNVTLSDVFVAEGDFSGAGELSAIECPAGTLAPGADLTCTATYIVQQADVDAGSVTNSATATSIPPGGDVPIDSPPSTVTIESVPDPALTIVKSSDTDELVVGETVTYSFLVVNTGNVTLSGVTVAEGDFSGAGEVSEVVCPAATLAPGADLTCTATYVVQQADVDAGSVTNTAIATGIPPGGDVPIDSPPSTVTIESVPDPALTIVKSSDTTELVLGETATFSFVATNTGNVTLSDVSVIEGEFTGAGGLSAIECPAEPTLAPGAQLICSATYVVQQADVDAGTMSNTATATGIPPGGDVPIDSPPSTVEVPSDPEPAITIVKSADTDELVAGETVTYSFRVTNTGNVTLSDAAVVEGDFSGAGELSAIECPSAALAPGAFVDCTATYVVQQADVDAGTVTNTATATGVPPGDDVPIDSPPSTVTIESIPSPALTIVKSSDTDELILGETVTYSFLVTNTGNVTLSDVAVAEGDFTGAGELSAIDCPAVTLAPGAETTCTATYVVEQADVDAGSVQNTATATGIPPGSDTPIPSPPSTVTIESIPDPAITIVKSSDTDELIVGETVTYSFLVANTGNVTLSDVTVGEGDFSGAGELSEVDCPAATLAPGVDTTCTATYVVEQADVDAGSVTNTATGTGIPPGSDVPIPSPPSTVTIESIPDPALTIVKSSDTDELVVGETVTYSFLVTNTGNVTLSDVTVADGDFSGAGELSEVDCPAAMLAPGSDATCTATYVVQQADVDAGFVENTATATGIPPGGDVPIDSPPSTVTIEVDPAPALSIVKSADTTDLVLGDTVTFSFVATNTGNVTLSDVSVIEGEFTGAGDLSALECPVDRTLTPGAQLICSATYLVQQADVDEGFIENSATATGIPPGGDVPIDSPPSTVELPSDPVPAISLVKTADVDELVVGETVTYTFRATNSGNVTLSDATVVEGEFTGAGDLSAVQCPEDRSLLPGEYMDCTATYVVLQADIDTGTVTNTASATGIPPRGEVPIESPPSTVTIESIPAPALTIVKTADTTLVQAGDTVTYTFLVTNTGNVTMSDVAVQEGEFTGAGSLSAIECPEELTLAPGAEMTCSATYVVQQADAVKGALQNTAIAVGTPPGSDEPISSDPSTVRISVVPPLPATGGILPLGATAAGVLLLLTGGVLLYARSLRKRTV